MEGGARRARGPTSSRGRERALGALFFLSGAAGLVYQVVWQRLLSVHYGVGAVSSAVIVSVFLFGLGVGSWLGGFLAERFPIRARHYSILEGLIGAFGIASPVLLRILGRTTAGSDIAAATVYVGLFLCVPTILMGMTLPFVVKLLSRTDASLGENLSWFYYVNTLGAAFGALLTSYVLIGVLGLDGATYVAVAINVALAAAIGRAMPEVASAAAEPAPSTPGGEMLSARLVFLISLVTGFLAIGYQIIWFRVVGVILKDSPYAFAATLGVYLLGIARGSAWIRRQLAGDGKWRPKDLLFALNGAIGLSAVVLAYGFYFGARYTPLQGALASLAGLEILPAPPSDGIANVLVTLGLTIVIPMLFLNLPTFLMGAAFPLVASLARKDSSDRPARVAGTTYFMTVLGNVAGGLVTGFWLLPRFGTERVLTTFGCAGLVFFVFMERVRARPLRLAHRLAGVAVGIGIILAISPPRTALYRAMHFGAPEAEAFVEEGTEGVVVTFRRGDEVRNTINGSTHGGRPVGVFWYEAATALAYAPAPKHVLVIGFGTGSVHEIALLDPRVERVTLVEVNATLLANLRKLPLFRDMLDDRRVELVVDDAHRHLQRTRDRYDAILMDPLRTRSALSNNLYSREFFALANEHLSPNGVLLVWTDETKILPRTFAHVFTHVAVHACEGTEWTFLVGSPRALTLDTTWFASQSATYPALIASALAPLRCPRSGREIPLAGPINETLRPRTEFYLGY